MSPWRQDHIRAGVTEASPAIQAAPIGAVKKGKKQKALRLTSAWCQTVRIIEGSTDREPTVGVSWRRSITLSGDNEEPLGLVVGSWVLYSVATVLIIFFFKVPQS